MLTQRPPTAEFEREVRTEMLHGVQILATLAGALYPTFLVMDHLLAPEHFAALVPVRLGFGAGLLGVAAGMWAIGRRQDLVPHAPGLAAVVVALCTGAVTAMIPILGDDNPVGVVSAHFLLPLAVIALMPLRPRAMGVVLTLLAVGSSGAMVVWSDGPLRSVVVEFSAIYACVVAVGVFMADRNDRLRRLLFENRKRTEQLLLNILPEDIALELRDRGRVEARNVDDCSILFTDFVGFTALSSRVSAAALVAALDTAFHEFDRIMAASDLEKLKTIGDAYMCAGGVMTDHEDHLERVLDAALAMLAALEHPDVRDPEGNPWRMRVGVHRGPVVAGVIGAQKFAFDLWGDTVNLAARAESAGKPGGICMTAETFRSVAHRYVAEPLGVVDLKGKGSVELIWVTGPRAADPEAT